MVQDKSLTVVVFSPSRTHFIQKQSFRKSDVVETFASIDVDVHTGDIERMFSEEDFPVFPEWSKILKSCRR